MYVIPVRTRRTILGYTRYFPYSQPKLGESNGWKHAFQPITNHFIKSCASTSGNEIVALVRSPLDLMKRPWTMVSTELVNFAPSCLRSDRTLHISKLIPSQPAISIQRQLILSNVGSKGWANSGNQAHPGGAVRCKGLIWDLKDGGSTYPDDSAVVWPICQKRWTSFNYIII